MVIDFRIRPPYGKGMGLGIYNGLVPNADPAREPFARYGRRRLASAMVPGGSMEKFIDEMDEAGVQLGVLMGRHTGHPVYGDTDNDELYELCEKYPDRFVAFAGISPLMKDPVAEIEKAAARGFRGVGLDPGWYVQEMKVDDERLMPVYEACAKHKLIASVTMSIYLGSDVSFSDPATIHRVARRFPELQIVIPHACWPHIPQAIGVALICPNVYLVPDCYLYVPKVPFADDLVMAANGLLQNKILFASSYPVRGLPETVERWSALPFEPDVLYKTLYYNARKLLNL